MFCFPPPTSGCKHRVCCYFNPLLQPHPPPPCVSVLCCARSLNNTLKYCAQLWSVLAARPSPRPRHIRLFHLPSPIFILPPRYLPQPPTQRSLSLPSLPVSPTLPHRYPGISTYRQTYRQTYTYTDILIFPFTWKICTPCRLNSFRTSRNPD